jgi:hypothetical protein
MNDAASAALSPESFSALALFLRADWVVKGVMLGLLGASLWSWSVIIDKVLKFRALAHDADQIEDAFEKGAIEQMTGFKFGMDQSLPTIAHGAGASYQTNTPTFTSGSSTLAVDVGTGALTAGQQFKAVTLDVTARDLVAEVGAGACSSL